MDSFTKRLVAVWALLAIIWLAWEAGGWDPLFRVSITACAFSMGLAWFDRRWIAATMALAYITPALIIVATGGFHIYFAAPWLAALIGALVVDAWQSPWRLPLQWRAPLVLWALSVVMGTSIVVLREYDFNPRLYFGPTVAPAIFGTPPIFAAIWALHAGSVAVAGILWFDWMHGLTADGFRRVVAAPLLAGFFVVCAVVLYQMFGHIQFLNQTVFGFTGRAAGTLSDANVSGTIVAMWIGASLVVARGRPWLAVSIVVAGWLAVWGTGSKTATVLALFATLGTTFAVVRGARSTRSYLPWLWLAGALAVLLLVLIGRPTVNNPWMRLARILPRDWSVSSASRFAVSLWNRDQYGPAAVAMIREFPITGVGPGSFTNLSGGYASFKKGGDNAQNWYRQELAELGLLGSVGWIAWLGGLAWALVARQTGTRESMGLRTSLLGFAAISFFGVPGQDPAVTLTFWTFAFWYLSDDLSPVASVRMGTVTQVAVLGCALAFSALTLRAATHDLRPPVRAVRSTTVSNPLYSYGTYQPEPGPDGLDWHWVEQRAVALADGQRPWMELRIRVNHGDVEARPVAVKAWTNNVEVIDARLSSGEPAVVYVRRPVSHRPLVVDTWVSRVVVPRELGLADPRILGALVAWRFVDAPPANAAIVRLR